MKLNFLNIERVKFRDTIRLTVVSPDAENALICSDDAQSERNFRVFATKDADIREDFDTILRSYQNDHPDVDIFYSDEIFLHRATQSRFHICKPQFSSTMLIAKDYLGYPLVVRESLLNDFGKYFGVMRSGDIYQMLVHAALLGKRFYRISEFLACTANVESTSNLGRRIRALEQEHKHAGHRFSFNTGLTSDTICQKKVFDSHPSVTIIVPTQRSCGQTRFGNRPHILNLLDSLATLTWPADKLEVIVGDDKGIESIYDEHNWSFKLTLLDTQRKHQAFNYAKKMNMLWRASQTENVIFMNDDLIVNSIDFIESLLTFSTETDVGGVGACLSFPDGNYQHVGMIGGIFGAFAHPWYKASPKKKHYGDWPLINREYSAVTGAVFATRRAVLEEINGFDEFFSLDFNDVDMCLRMRLLGYRIIYTPFASLVHLEGASRSGATAPGNQILTFLNKWRDVIDDDPMYNPSLSRNSDEVFCHLDD